MAAPPAPTAAAWAFAARYTLKNSKDISFSLLASDGPPLFKDHCLPDPPAFNNPFAWKGKSIREPIAQAVRRRVDALALLPPGAAADEALSGDLAPLLAALG